MVGVFQMQVRATETKKQITKNKFQIVRKKCEIYSLISFKNELKVQVISFVWNF